MLCRALLDYGCDEALVGDFKDAFLASLAGEESYQQKGRQAIARHLSEALQGYYLRNIADIE